MTVLPASRKGSFENEPFGGPFFRAESHQISPFSTKNVQITPQNGVSGHRFFECAACWEACPVVMADRRSRLARFQ